jgi:Ca2+-binding RTX toxin-like protein
VQSAQTTDVVDQPAWGDTIVTGEGVNIVLAGLGDDHVNDPAMPFSAGAVPSASTDYVIGDNGVFNWDSAGLLESFMSTNPFVPQAGPANPFDGIDVGGQNAPVFADLDGDGDADLVMGESDGTLLYFLNTGTTAAPVFVAQAGALNPLDGVDVGSQSAPAFADLDGDGDLDLVVGEGDGTLTYYENIGTPSAPAYVERAGAANPFDGVDIGSQSTPAFADLDGDGDFDLVAGESGGTLLYFENTGTSAAPAYVQQTGAANPFDGIDAGSQSAPAFADLEGDGDLDLVVGESLGTLLYFENLGSATAPDYVQQTGAANPFDGIDAGIQGMPAFADLDGDGDADALVGEVGGGALYFAHDHVGGDDVIVVGDGENVVVGGFGNDTITTGVDADIVLGDNGEVSFTPGTTQLLQARSTDSVNATGGDDTILAGDGDNLVLAGVGADTVTTGSGTDLILGDNGQIDWTAAGEYATFQTTDPELGAADVIDAGDGDNIVAGGFGADQISAGTGEDLILGDNGIFEFTTSTGNVVNYNGAGGQVTVETADLLAVLAQLGVATLADLVGLALQITMASNDTALGQSQPITAVAAGALPGTTVLTLDEAFLLGAGTESDLLGYLITSATGTGGVATLTGASTTDTTTATGGDDVIFSGGGTTDNIVLAGMGNDQVNQGAAAVSSGADIVVGDNGAVIWDESGQILQIASTLPDLGGDDLINVGDGDNIILGGVGDDVATAGSGLDIALGDNGTVNWDETGLLTQFASTAPTLGGDDQLDVGDGDNVVVGGFGDDTVIAGTGTDIVLGDNGQVTYTPGTALLQQAVSTDADNLTGGNDTILVGGVNNLVLVDLDGDLDAVAGSAAGTLLAYENVGTAAAPVYVELTGAANPFDGIDVGTQSTPSFVDLDGDGDLDAVVGAADGTLHAYENTGTALAPAYAELAGAANPLGGVDVGAASTPAFADLDGDGDLDVVVGAADGTLHAFENTGTALAPAYAELTGAANPLAGLVAEGGNLVIAGVGADTVTAGSGDDLILGDNGQIDWTATGEYSAFQTTGFDQFLGGDDVINGGDGDNIVAGGFGADQVTTGLGEDLILGDNGLFGFTLDGAGNAVLTEASTTDTTGATGGDDVIISGGGSSSNIVLAGVGADQVNQTGATSTGQDIVIGDNGYVNWDTGGQLTQFGSAQPELGGNDLINVGDGQNIVVGGFGDDIIATGVNADIVLGDDGQVDYVGTDGNSADIDSIISTSTTAFGGADTITTSGGDDIVIGGRADDVIDAGDGDNLVIGDSGQIFADTVDAPQMAGQPITLGLVESVQLDDGGADTIVTGAGNDIVIGGFGGDTATTGAGNDTVFGDNGLIDYTNAVPTLLVTTDVDATTGGNDVIDGGDGNNTVFGGVGSDSITTGSGADVVLGDNGTVVNDGAGNLFQVITGDPVLGGDDVLSTGDGTDVAMGGAFNDTVVSGAGNDILFGDGGSVTYPGGTNLVIESVDPDFGGNDVIDGGAGNDIVIGGQGTDLLYGSFSEDLLFGGNAAVTMSGGIVTTIETDMQDLAGEALFKLFNALPGDEDDDEATGERDPLPGYAAYIDGLPEEITVRDALLDPDLFEKVFNLSGSAGAAALAHASALQDQYTFTFATLQEPPAPGGDADSVLIEVAAAAGGGHSPLAALGALRIAAQAGAIAEPGRSGEALAAAMGIAGLQAARQERERGRARRLPQFRMLR